jgi:hypothetical protein
VLLAVAAWLTPMIFQAALGLPPFARVALVLAVIAPLGIVLGTPFPAGLPVVAAEAPGLVPWVWGINAFFTVIGTILAVMFAMIFGFITVLVMAGVCYVLAWLALVWTRGAGKTSG